MKKLCVKNQMLILLIVAVTLMSPTFALNNSFVEIEVAYQGELTATWDEHTTVEWTVLDSEGNYSYRWSTATDHDIGWTISCDQTLNRTQNVVLTKTYDADTYAGVVFLYVNESLWYGVLAAPGSAYVVKYNGSLYGCDGIGWTDDEQSWLPYKDDNIDPCANITWMKTLFSRYTGHLLWKGWTTGLHDTEPNHWTIDLTIAELQVEDPFYFGLCAYNAAEGATYADFTMYGLVKCTYEMDAVTHAEAVPVLQPKILSASNVFGFIIDVFTEMEDMMIEEELTEQQMMMYIALQLQRFINWFDHSSWLSYTTKGDQDDQIYVYSLVMRDFLSLADQIDEEYIPWNMSANFTTNSSMQEFINNFLVILVEDCTDGTDNDDWCLVMVDSDHDHEYDEDDWSFVLYGNSSESDALSFQGTTAMMFEDEVPYVLGTVGMGSNPLEMIFHRYADHRQYMFLIPLGLLESDHTSGTMVNVDDTMGIMIAIDDNESMDIGNTSVWGAWCETDNSSLSPSELYDLDEILTFNVSSDQCSRWGHLCIEGVNAETGYPEPDLDKISAGSSSGFSEANLPILLILAAFIIILIVIGMALSKR